MTKKHKNDTNCATQSTSTEAETNEPVPEKNIKTASSSDENKASELTTSKPTVLPDPISTESTDITKIGQTHTLEVPADQTTGTTNPTTKVEDLLNQGSLKFEGQIDNQPSDPQVLSTVSRESQGSRATRVQLTHKVSGIPDLSKIKNAFPTGQLAEIGAPSIEQQNIHLTGFVIEPDSLSDKVLERPHSIICHSVNVIQDFQQPSSITSWMQMPYQDLIFDETLKTFNKGNAAIAAVKAAWNSAFFDEFNVKATNGVFMTDSLFEKFVNAANVNSMSDMERLSGAIVALIAIVKSCKPLQQNSQSIIRLNQMASGYDHINRLSHRDLMVPTLANLAFFPIMSSHSRINQRIQDDCEESGWTLGRLNPYDSYNGHTRVQPWFESIDHISAAAHNHATYHAWNTYLETTYLEQILQSSAMPGANVKLLDNSGRGRVHIELFDHNHNLSALLVNCAIDPDFARNIRLELISFMEQTNAVTPAVNKTPRDDPIEAEVGMSTYLAMLRNSTPQDVVDTFYSTQTPRLTLPIIKRIPTAPCSGYGAIAPFICVIFVKLFPTLAYYCRSEIARVVHEWAESNEAVNAQQFVRQHGNYDNIPGNRTSFDISQDRAGRVPSIFLGPFQEDFGFLSLIMNHLHPNPNVINRRHDQDHNPRLEQNNNRAFASFPQRMFAENDSEIPLNLNAFKEEYIHRVVRPLTQTRSKTVSHAISVLLNNIVEDMINASDTIDIHLAQAERMVTALPLAIGTMYQGNMGAPFPPIIAVETSNRAYHVEPMFVEREDPTWMINMAVIMSMGRDVVFSLGQTHNTTASSSIPLLRAVQFPDTVECHIRHLRMLKTCINAIYPFGVVNEIYRNDQANGALIRLRHRQTLRSPEVTSLLTAISNAVQVADKYGIIPPSPPADRPIEFAVMPGEVKTLKLNNEKDTKITTVKTVLDTGNVTTRRGVLIDPHFRLYSRQGLRLPVNEQVGYIPELPVQLITDYDRQRLEMFADPVLRNNSLTNIRRGVVILRRSVHSFNADEHINPYLVHTAAGYPFQVFEIGPNNLTVVTNQGRQRFAIRIGAENGQEPEEILCDEQDFDGYIFSIAQPNAIPSQWVDYLCVLVSRREFGIYFPDVEYIQIVEYASSFKAQMQKDSINLLFNVATSSIPVLKFYDTRHERFTLNSPATSELFKTVFPANEDQAPDLARHLYDIADRPAENQLAPPLTYYHPGTIGGNWIPHYSNGRSKLQVNAFSNTNQVMYLTPHARIAAATRLYHTPPASIQPA